MRSIRSYLAIRLLIGFVVLLSLASVFVFVISKRILEADFDGRLFAKAQAVIASTSQRGVGLDVDWGHLPQEIGAHGQKRNLIEFLDASETHLDGEAFLQIRPRYNADHPVYWNAESKEGEDVRVLAISFLPLVEKEDRESTPPSLRHPVVLIVGSDRDPLEHSLDLMAVVLVAMTLLTSGLSVGIVIYVLRLGLRPLASLSQEVSQIDERSLDKRVEAQALPVEVIPVAEKVNELLGRLEVSFAREREFSADISHELRTPVAELKTLAEVTLLQTDLSPEVRQGFEDALAIACQMEALVTMLLEMVRQERSETVLQTYQVNLETTVFTIWNKLQAKARQRNISLNCNLSTGETVLWTEPPLLSTVLMNLFDNAIEYSPPSTVVDVEWKKQGKNPCLVISNTPANLSPADLPHLFDRFWRKDKARSESGHFGIGLALTRTICHRLGIHLTVSMDKGLVHFWLHFPEKGNSHES